MELELFHVAFGSLLIATSLFCIILYTIIQKIILFDGNFMKHSSYKIVVCYGFVDIIQLIVYVWNGIFAIVRTNIHPWLEKICGFQLSFCWYNIGSLTVLLAINRLCLLHYGARAELFFTPRRTWVILAIGMFIPSMFSLIWLTPFATYGFDAENLLWQYSSFQFMPEYDRLITLITSVVSTICYVLILALVLRKSWTARYVGDNSRRRDTLLTLQVAINGGFTVCVSSYFMFFRPYYVPYTVFYNGLDLILCLIWNGKSPVMHLIFNGQIRQKFIEFMIIRRPFSPMKVQIFSRHMRSPMGKGRKVEKIRRVVPIARIAQFPVFKSASLQQKVIVVVTPASALAQPSIPNA